MIDPILLAHLAGAPTIELTTYGRRSGKSARIEIWWFQIEDRFIITGTPGKRDWYANVRANPRIIVHTAKGDFEAEAEVVEDPEFRRRVFCDPAIGWYQTQSELDDLVATAPMIAISFG